MTPQAMLDKVREFLRKNKITKVTPGVVLILNEKDHALVFEAVTGSKREGGRTAFVDDIPLMVDDEMADGIWQVTTFAKLHAEGRLLV